MNDLLRDLRSAVRTLGRRPELTLAALLTVALAIGANTTIFMILERMLIQPLPYRDADRLVYLYLSNPRNQVTTTPSPELIRLCREQARSFEQVVSFSTRTFHLTGEGEPARVSGGRVSPGLFSFLGVEPLLGRTFAPDEERTGHHRVVVLTYGIWQRRFGGDPEVLGRSLTLDDETYRIVGVLPAEFHLDAYSDIRFWIPQVTDARPDVENPEPVYAIARLAEGISPAVAQAELDVLSRQLGKEEGEDPHGLSELELTGKVVPPEESLDPKVRTAILVLQAAVACVLLIACGNIANLLLAQGESRVRELALRAALGARRARLVRQLLTESLVLSLLGGALGLLLSWWGFGWVVSLAPQQLSRLQDLQLEPDHLAFTFLVAVVAGIAFGLVPALRGSAPALVETLKHGGSHSPHKTLVRETLVAAEVALSVVLLIGAGLLVKNFVRLKNDDPGFAAENLLTLALELPEKRYAEAESQTAFFDGLFESLGSLGPQVESVALTSAVGSNLDVLLGKPELEGHPANLDQPLELLVLVTGTPGYFQTMGVPLRRGRGFAAADRDGEPVVVLNETLARRLLPGESPVGLRIRFSADRWFRIVGVAADVRLPAMRHGGRLDRMLFVPAAQDPSPGMTVVVRSKMDRETLVAAVKARIWAIDPDVPVTRIATGEELLADSLDQQRFAASLMTLFAAVAALLAAVGIGGVVVHAVSQRARELGIRVALGARERDVLRHVMTRIMRPAILGMLVGLGGALALSRSLGGLLHDVSVEDPATYATVILLATAITFFASWLPARRAVPVDPVTVLRDE